MSKLADLKKHIEAAREVESGITYKYRVFHEPFKDERARIERAFRGDAYETMRKLLEERQTRELMHMMRNETRQYRDNAAKAKKLAEDIVHGAVPAADPVKAERFERRLADLKTEILLSEAKKGADALRQFITEIDEPAFAERVRSEFSELVAPILSSAGPEAGKYRVELTRAFDTVRSAQLTEEAREAQRLLGVADAMLSKGLCGLIVVEHAKEAMGPKVAALLNDPDRYFEENPEAANVAPGQKTETESAVEYVLTMQDRPASPYVSPSGPGSARTVGKTNPYIIPPSPFDRE